MKDIIIIRPEKCTGCNSCVRSCPAPEANVFKTLDDGRKMISVNATKCIACGECVKACPQGARDYVDDTEQFMARISDEKMILLVDPSIKNILPTQWKHMLDWFKRKGCLIYDVSFGADIAAWALLSAIESQKMGNIISRTCSAVLNYAKIYQPNLMKNIAPIYSPSVCMAIYIKNYLRRSNHVAMLSACVAKKLEYIDTGLIDYNITVKKVMQYFDKNDIVIPSGTYDNFDYDFEDKPGQLGAINSRPGGLRENILYHNPDVKISSSSGSHVYPELELYASLPQTKLPDVFDVLSCEYGCDLGPGAGTDLNSFEVMCSVRDIEVDVKAKLNKGKGMFRNNNEDKLFKRFDEEFELDDFLRSYRSSKTSPEPTLDDIEPIFESMGKHSDSERNHNCGGCGYKSCHEMAKAIFRELNTKENCVVYALKNGGSGAGGSGISAKVTAAVDSITANMTKIAEANTKNSEKTKVVNDLLKNVVAFCGKNATMDANSVSQMIKILETTIKSLSAFDENADAVSKSVEEINGLIESLKAAN